MMFSDEEIKEMPGNIMRAGDEIISIREVCLVDNKYNNKKDFEFNEPLLLNAGKNDLDVSRSLFRDGFFPEDQHQARFAWTEEDGNIASLVSEPGFGTTGQTTFGKDLDAALNGEMKDTSSGADWKISRKAYGEPQRVTSTSDARSKNSGACKVDKSDPRSRFHYVKYVKRHGRTVKLWECGMCSREFQHQYTLMRHLPTHTDERNFHCDDCGKSFRQLSTLSQHRAIHSADRPYACEVCQKTFNRVSTLISHRKTHSDEKPYRCHYCTKGFHQKGNLRNHLFTHTNERPYRCNICMKGFNQQSNLVCHKNKAHPDDGCPLMPARGNIPCPTRTVIDSQPNSVRPQTDHCEVSSTVPFLPNVEIQSWPKTWDIIPLHYSEAGPSTPETPWGVMGSGVIVDPIKTYHMGVALANRQTPFALLKPSNATPVLVKVVDTLLPGGKQMLVPATAEDLKVGGKIVVNNDENGSSQDANKASAPDVSGAVQIRVPVVAVVVPKVNTGGRLHLAVEEPHHAYHTAVSGDGKKTSDVNVFLEQRFEVGEVKVEPCESPEIPHCHSDFDAAIKHGPPLSSSCTLHPPAPSPPADLISMDLFEPMEYIPMIQGPQLITAVDSIDHPPSSDDSDIFIGQFEDNNNPL